MAEPRTSGQKRAPSEEAHISQATWEYLLSDDPYAAPPTDEEAAAHERERASSGNTTPVSPPPEQPRRAMTHSAGPAPLLRSQSTLDAKQVMASVQPTPQRPPGPPPPLRRRSPAGSALPPVPKPVLGSGSPVVLSHDPVMAQLSPRGKINSSSSSGSIIPPNIALMRPTRQLPPPPRPLQFVPGKPTKHVRKGAQPPQPPPLDERGKMLRKRAKIAAEMRDTERTYLHQLSIIVSNFMTPLKKLAILSQEEINNLFSNVEVIQTLHSKFLERLSERVEAWDSSSVIGDIFQETNWIKLYKYYINNYETALGTLRQCKEKKTEFLKFVETVAYTDALDGLSFESYLVVPVQRIPRYVLLLNEMKKSTPEGHADQQPLMAALDHIKELADYINEKKRVSENQAKLCEIRARWKKFKGDLHGNPDRVFLRDFAVSCGPWSKLHVWLFSDIAVITSGDTSLTGKFVFKYAIALQTAAVQPGSNGCAFKLLGPNNCVTGTCDTEDLRELQAAVDRAHDTLIRSAFRRTLLVADPREVSQQFLQFQIEEYKARRTQAMTDLVQSEREYWATVDITYQVLFLADDVTIPACLASPWAETAEFIKSLSAIHSELLHRLEEREKVFAVLDTIADIFADMLPDLSTYTRFAARHKDFRIVLDQAVTTDVLFFRWLAGKEERNGLSLGGLFERVLRRIPDYYLVLQDMLTNTPKNTPDYESISKAALEMDAIKSQLSKKSEGKHAAILGLKKS